MALLGDSSGRKMALAIMVALLFSCALPGVILGQALPQNRAQALEEAQARWAKRPFANYRMLVQIDNTPGTPCQQDVEIEQEIAVAHSYNTCRFRGLPVSGMFTLIADNQPSIYRCVDHGCACDTVMSMHTSYDQTLGYPREIIFQWMVQPNWLHIDFWKAAWASGGMARCRTTFYTRTTRVLALFPLPNA